MADITVNNNPNEEELRARGVFGWPIWTHEAAEFPWSYDERETCYLLEGEVTVTPDGGTPVSFGKGDFVTFSRGMSCTWKITRAVKKHYNFG